MKTITYPKKFPAIVCPKIATLPVHLKVIGIDAVTGLLIGSVIWDGRTGHPNRYSRRYKATNWNPIVFCVDITKNYGNP